MPPTCRAAARARELSSFLDTRTLVASCEGFQPDLRRRRASRRTRLAAAEPNWSQYESRSCVVVIRVMYAPKARHDRTRCTRNGSYRAGTRQRRL